MSTAAHYQVVVNDEEQHALWPAGTPLPAGWRAEGFTGSEEECSAHVDEVWPDIRPLSLRRRTAGPAE
ncbi:MbtH family NRPS accessory protein [Kitasatospora sp. A2-31]|uniref:MbtH family protein n=1 Tax=Kitasatospora sp. A2-31 TaxID=2916414 RepID=UPI001EEB5B81|nr:MbtH family NRPS accessory protein [Kitasatospora sp. A2-31]MCG6495545.1 MbtH family NRPS accessory protein [Kitasatospora sp. A2-31]